MPIPHRTLEQRRESLELANKVRLLRARLKQEIRQHRVSLPDVLDPYVKTKWDETAQGMSVDELLQSMAWVGRTRASKLMSTLYVGDHRPRLDVRVGDLGEPRLAMLAMVLRKRRGR